MRKLFFLFLCIVSTLHVSAFSVDFTDLLWDTAPAPAEGLSTPMRILVLVQDVILWGVLPVAVVGVSLYTAYQLFMAEGNADRLKTAIKTIIYGIAGIIIALLAYAFVRIVTTLNIF